MAPTDENANHDTPDLGLELLKQIDEIQLRLDARRANAAADVSETAKDVRKKVGDFADLVADEPNLANPLGEGELDEKIAEATADAEDFDAEMEAIANELDGFKAWVGQELGLPAPPARRPATAKTKKRAKKRTAKKKTTRRPR